jgi:hypothetical protein
MFVFPHLENRLPEITRIPGNQSLYLLHQVGNTINRATNCKPSFDALWPCYRAEEFFFFSLDCEAIGTAATPGLLCQPRVIVKMIVEKQMECELTGETKVLGENLPQRHFCPSQNLTWPDPGLNPGRRGGKPASNRLSYGAAGQRSYWTTRILI